MTGLAATNISVSLGAQQVLRGASIEANPGELVGLLGPNGSGKTTLLKCLAGLITPDGGTRKIGDETLESLPVAAIARKIAWLEQDAASEWPLSVLRVVSLGRMPWLGALGKLGPDDLAAIDHAMEICGVKGLADRSVTNLSGGERARVMLARAMAAEPEILLADEPVAQLDPYHQLGVMEVLQDHARKQNAVVAVMHDLSLAARFCDRVCLLSGGKIVASGAPSGVLVPDRLAEVFAIEAEMFQNDGVNFVLPRRQKRP